MARGFARSSNFDTGYAIVYRRADVHHASIPQQERSRNRGGDASPASRPAVMDPAAPIAPRRVLRYYDTWRIRRGESWGPSSGEAGSIVSSVPITRSNAQQACRCTRKEEST